MASVERTRALIERHLGFELAQRTGDAYRDPDGSPLRGEWLGAFAQPGVILNTVTAMSARLDARGGAAIDEYGESAWTDLVVDGDRVSWRKRYVYQQFAYVGQHAGGVLAGYWYAPGRPAFAGVFWMAREDRLAEATAAALRGRVRSTSPRRTIAKAAGAVIPGLLLVGSVGNELFAVAGAIAAGVFVWMLRERIRVLQREVALWRRQLGRAP